jgi:subtilase family serine protease
VSDTTKNQGGGGGGPSLTRFFLSTNAVLDASDVLLGDRAVPSLPAAAANTGASSLVIPADTMAGSYYILARADGEGTIPETSETNNTRTVLIAIGPDLVITALTAPSSAAAGATVNVSDTTKNQGAGGATGSTTSFYLSTNATFDALDVFLGSRAVSDLPAGAASTAATPLTLPANTAAGSYYILARADGEEGEHAAPALEVADAAHARDPHRDGADHQPADGGGDDAGERGEHIDHRDLRAPG